MNRGLRLFKKLYKHHFVYSYSTLPSELIVFMDDNMIVCWHPEQPFPYECSKPLPINKSEDPSVLKIGNKDIKEMFHKTNKELIPHELAALTYTTKHRWYPRARDKKFNTSTPMNRKYL
jgi:large subunit ribosomal protein L42